MGRILGIDYGAKRTGLAVTDPLKIIASALTTIETPKAFEFIAGYIKENDVEKIVIGYPTDMKGNPTHATPLIDRFIIRLKKKFPDMEIIQWDEAFTSKRAVKTLIDSGVKKKDRRNKALIDSVAATIILQEYLQNI